MRIVLTLFLTHALLFGAIRHFSIHEMDGKEAGNKLFIIGGIHGDEPGGYFAPALVVQHYTIKKGSLLVVPNLNFDSIVQNRRGIYGDMNRKFDHIDQSDPDFELVTHIKSLITDPSVDFIINLHDGRGFYRTTWESAIFNPRAWGQAYIIDQKTIDDVKFGNLDEVTTLMVEALNQSNLAANHHQFDVKNTYTKDKDEQMRMSLTYYAITHLKPALAIETSKNITELDTKVLYQLLSMEALLNHMGIEFERDFELTLEEVDRLLANYGTMNLNNRFSISLSDARNALHFIPMRKEGNVFEFSHPLGTTIDRGSYHQVMIGNIPVAKLYPQYFSLTCNAKTAKIEVDGHVQTVSFGETVHIKNTFNVLKDEAFRVNLIGFVTKDRDSQDGITVQKSDFISRFSIDRSETAFRAEFYDNGDFCGTITVVFE
ncbi:MAG: succinylglutamate desuccinylase/aspartoacylase family protein [Campylobacterales bacterium]|nr:succinylglutamate desuccinylase/aspartoacylase family protein [Campylobacterales bacterium]